MMNTESGTPQQPETSPARSASDNENPVVNRRRSSHHHHRSNARKVSAHERELRLKKRHEIKILGIFAPTLLVLVGGVIWVLAHKNPDPSMHHQGLISLSHYMLGIGLTFGIVALLVDWTRRVLVIRKEKRKQTAEAQARGRRRSSHRRHRQH